MYQVQQSVVQNRLLKAMKPSDFTLLQPHLQPIALVLRQTLIHPDTPIKYVYFPETGVISITAQREGDQIEVGLIGREGLAGASSILLGDDRSPHEHMVQIAGSALRVPTDALLVLTQQSPSLFQTLLRFVQIELIQTRQTAFTNAAFGNESRLARWLLMCHDRVDGDELTVTHEFLAVMLGVSRPGLTLTLQNLEGAGRIKTRRGRVTVIDRGQLKAIADESYGLPEAEYARLIEGA